MWFNVVVVWKWLTKEDQVQEDMAVNDSKKQKYDGHAVELVLAADVVV